MGHTDNDFALLRRSEKLAAKQASHNLSNNPLAQTALTIEEKTAAFASERNARENSTVFVPIKYSDLPPNANVIKTHIIFKRKDRGRVKARSVP